MRARHWITLIALSAATSASAAPTCPKGQQPYGERCVSERMSDYISCVEASGGNRELIIELMKGDDRRNISVDGRGAGSGIVAEGSGSLSMSLADEKDAISRIETRWFPSGMSDCAKVLDRPRRMGAEQRVLQRIEANTKIVANNTPTVEHPVLDLSAPLKDQIRLYATDDVVIVGYTQPFVRLRLGRNLSVFRPEEDQNVRRYTVWADEKEIVVPQFIDEHDRVLTQGQFKLLVEYRTKREMQRDIRANVSKPNRDESKK